MADVAHLNVRITSDSTKALRDLAKLNAALDSLSRRSASSRTDVDHLSRSVDNQAAIVRRGTSAHNDLSRAVTRTGSTLYRTSGEVSRFTRLTNAGNKALSLFRRGVGMSDQALSNNAMHMGRWAKIAVAATAAAITLVPVIQGTGAVLGGLTSMLASAGVGLGVFGLAVMSAFQNGSKASKQLNQELENLKGSFMGWGSDVAPMILRPVQVVFRALELGFYRLTPLVSALTPIANQVADAFAHWMNIKLDGWIKFFSKTAPPAVAALVTIFKNVGATLGELVKQFAGFGDGVGNAMAVATAKMKGWAQRGGFTDFLDRFKKEEPTVKKFFDALWGSLKNLWAIMQNMSSGFLANFTSLLQAIANMDPSGVKAMASVWLAWKSPLLWVLANCPPLRDLIVSLLGAMDAKVVYALAAAFLVWKAAMWAVNTTLVSTPIGLLLVGIAALVAAIIIIATKTTWFQTAWKYTWNAVVAVATTVWSALQTAFGAVMDFIHGKWGWVIAFISPLGWMIYVATNWQKIWGWIQTAFSTTVNAIVNGWQWVSNKVVGIWNWLWNNIFKPIGDVFMSFLPHAVSVLTGMWQVNWQKVSDTTARIFYWLRDNVWNPIVWFFTKGIPTAAKSFANGVYANWQWCSDRIASIFYWLRNNVWNPIVSFFANKIPAAAKSFANGVKANWQWCSDRIASIYYWLRDHIWKPMVNWFTKTIPDAAKKNAHWLRDNFNNAVNWIKSAWNKLQGIFKAPIKFLIDVVFNKGIVGLWNNTAAKIPGISKMGKMAMPKGFATGGHTGPGAKYQPAGIVHADEYVIKKESQRKMAARNPGALDYINKTGALPGYANGGGVIAPKPPKVKAPGGGTSNPSSSNTGGNPRGDVKGPAGSIVGKKSDNPNPASGAWDGGLGKTAWGWATGILREGAAKAFEKTWNLLVNPLKKMIPTSGTGEYGKGLQKWPDTLRDKAIQFIKGKEESEMGGANVGKALEWAKKQAGKPYVWAGGGPDGWDCSGFMYSIQKVIDGKDPIGRGWSTFDFQGKNAPKGWEERKKAPFMIGITNEGKGHTAGTINGTNVEATPPVLRYGPNARGYNDSMFTDWYGYKPSRGGGEIPTGQHKSIIDEALKRVGIPKDQWPAWEAGMNTLIQRESGWNASAQNNYDSNAANGTPSKGLAQVIQPTFDAYRLGNGDIWDAVANVTAAINYIKYVYGGIGNVQQANAGQAPKGYFRGGVVKKGWAITGEKGPELINVGSTSRVMSNKDSQEILSGNSGGGDVNFNYYGTVYQNNPEETANKTAFKIRTSGMGWDY